VIGDPGLDRWRCPECHVLAPEVVKGLRFVCSDMWKPYLQVIAAQAGQALHVLDRFHITSHLNQAVDQVRRAEGKRLRTKSKKAAQRLKHMRWPLLRRGSRVRGKARQKLNALFASKLATARAWDLKETFSHFWRYKSVIWAGAFLDYWCFRAMRSRLEPMKRVARMLRTHEPLLLNWFRAKGEISNGAVEGLNNKIRVVTRRSYGFRTYNALEIALYHNQNQPIDSAEDALLLTAAHVLDENRRTSLYVGGVNELVPLAGSSHRTGTPIAGRPGDTFDFGFVDISDTPPEQWLRYQFVTPDYLDVDDVPAADVLYAFVGYPETRNKRLKGQKFQLSPMAIVLMPTPLKRYDSLGLNPTAQFAGEFSRNKQLDSEKRIVVGPEPHGISGGGVWRLGTPREFATGTNAERLVYRFNKT